MELFSPVILAPISLYCERTGRGLWDEPFALIASLAFLPVGWRLWHWSRDLPQLRLMAGLVLLLGIGATLLHMVPNRLTLAGNLVPVLAVILYVFYLLSRDVLRLAPLIAALTTLLILPFATVSLFLVTPMRGAVSTSAYAAVLVLILGYAATQRQEAPRTARGLFLAAVIMALGLAARSADLPLCGIWPHGTHFLWDIAAALLLLQLGSAYRRHMLDGRG